MKERIQTGIVLGLIFLVFVGLFVAEPESGTVFSSTPLGSKALDMLFVELGFQTQHLGLPLSEIATDASNHAVLFSISPATSTTWKDIETWIKKGNRLVLLSALSVRKESCFVPYFGKGQPELKASQSLLPAKISSVQELLASERTTENIACSSEISPICAHSYRLDVDPLQAKLSIENFQPLSKDGNFSSVHYRALGKGDIILVSDPSIAYNDNIDREDNATFLVDLARGRSPVYFDEFHHGFVAPVSAQAKDQYENIVFLAAVILGILILVAASRMLRFGKPQERLIDNRLESSDFVTALGILYADNDNTEVLRYYLDAWRERLRRSREVLVGNDSNALADELVSSGIVPSSEKESVHGAFLVLAAGERVTSKRGSHCIETLEQVISGERRT